MRAPCELVVKYFLPAMRANIAAELLGMGWTQTEISKKLGLTQAAVSKYASGKLDRGIKDVAKIKEMRSAAKRIAKRIAEGGSSVEALSLLCETCVALRKRGLICDLHAAMLPAINPRACKICGHLH